MSNRSFGRGIGLLAKLSGLGGKRDHTPRFDKILPSAMKSLVNDGYFVVDKNVEGGYKITELGMQKLKELENDQHD